MRTVVLSKQCDYDADLFRLWAMWYRKIMKVDEIVLTPIHVRGANRIEETLSFYEEVADEIEVIEQDAYDIPAAWAAQLKVLEPHVDADTFWISADGDQFLDLDTIFVQPSGQAVFRRTNLYTRHPIDPDTLEETPVFTALPDGRKSPLIPGQHGKRVCGLKGRLTHPGMTTTGNAIGPRCSPEGQEYHVAARGAGPFVTKAAMYGRCKSRARKHRVWYNRLQELGEGGLRKVYEDHIRKLDLIPHTAFKERFRVH